MQDLIKRTKNIIDKYKDELTKLGIKITVSRNQYETAVHERHRKNSPFNVIDYGIDYKRETERGYKFQSNKYIGIILKVLPLEDGILKQEDCREYSFTFIKTERACLGDEPKHIKYNEDVIISKINKLVLKIIKNSKNKTPKKICKNTIKDVFRYTHRSEYKYIDKVLGKDTLFWDMMFAIGLALVVFGLLVFASYIIK